MQLYRQQVSPVPRHVREQGNGNSCRKVNGYQQRKVREGNLFAAQNGNNAVHNVPHDKRSRLVQQSDKNNKKRDRNVVSLELPRKLNNANNISHSPVFVITQKLPFWAGFLAYARIFS